MGEGIDAAERHGKKIRNRGSGVHRDPNEIKHQEYIEDVPIPHRKKCRTKNKIELSEKIYICHQVIHQMKPLRQVAKEHRVTQSWISRLVQKVRKNHNLLSELLAAKEHDEIMKEEAGNAVISMYKHGNYLNSIKYMQEKLKEEYGIEIKYWKLMQLLVHNLDMKYKKVKPISMRANDPKNLILRQQFAKSFLDLDFKKKRVWNVDETWLGMTDFRRRKWTLRSDLNSVAKKQMQPRVSMITALDSNGSLYISLL